ncbi:3-hydroxyacyl-CoA dehydrogenase NAD-binding domain-containing protein [Terrarubrum flagellatum]|uniref:3-hydroxyacyl-CoA dehydrogenase NAD-binding domain-containing protein n=1 Tax=Terrirubrum flagellatum TaxID=2895980 RepID=UPI003145411D
MNDAFRNPVSTSQSGEMMLAFIDNPPVNALSHGVRAGLVGALDAFEANASAKTLVLICKGRTFVVGADIRELGRPMLDPQLAEVIARLDACAKPVIAAIHGTALGGGLELALACNYRIAARDARLGVPEVKLGILPGAGGVVRLPRLVGVETALKMISGGVELTAAQAFECGLIDEITDGDLQAGATVYAQRLIAEDSPPRRVSERPFPAFDKAAAEAARTALARKYRGFNAPQVAVDLFEMAAETPFAEAAVKERTVIRGLVTSPQSKALRHLFVAERAAQKLDGATADAQPRPIKSVVIAGTGLMARGIAVCCLDVGLPVILLGRSEASLAKARGAVANIYEGQKSRGSLSQEETDSRLARLSATTSLDDLKSVDLAIETIAEEVGPKREMIARLSRALRDDAIIATNTSFLDIDDLATASAHPENICGMHFFNPAYAMKLLENVRATKTAPDVLATIMQFGKALGKIPVMVGRSEGFVANRMLSKRTREALFLLEEGATPWQIDAALVRFGFPVGPLALADMAGLDVIAATRRARFSRMTARERSCDIVDRLIAAGRLGQKSGAGYYAYDEKRKSSPDKATEDLLGAYRAERGLTARAISDQEIVERCLYAMINEAALILEEGGAARAGDVDVIWTSGFGFPRYLGGPMFYADQVGLPEIAKALRGYGASTGEDHFRPAPLIERLAAEGRGFHG